MTNTKHTPGPWTIGRVEQGPDSKSIYIEAIDGYTAEIAQVWGHNSDGDLEANARLIAAAPKMLAALKEIQKRIAESDLWWMDCPERGGFDLEGIESIISEAKGGAA